MTSSDEAVERGARALAANEDEDWWSGAHDEFRSADRRAWNGDEEVHVATCHRFIARAVLDASGEYQRAVSDVVEFLRGAAVEEHIIDELQEAIPRGTERFAPTSEVTTDA